MAELKKIFDLIAQSGICEKKVISGVKEGEKSLIIASKKRGVVLSSDFVQAVKLKRNLNSLGFSCEVLSSGREVGAREDDENLTSFAAMTSAFLQGEIDFLIFLPNAIISKFDLQFLQKPLILEKGKTIPPQELSLALSKMGYERVSLVSSEGEFALRGDILDIFPLSKELPVRCDFFDEEIENLSYFNPNDMKNVEKIEKICIFPRILPKGNNNVTDLSENIFVDQQERIEGQIELLFKSYRVMTGFDQNDFASFEELKKGQSFVIGGGEDVGSGAEINYVHNFVELGEDLKIFDSHSKRMVLFAGDEQSKNRIKNFLLGKDISFYDYEQSSFSACGIYVSEKYFPSSFSFPKLMLYAIGSDNLTRQKPSIARRAKKDAFYAPKVGEFVVHDFHGIGKCVGVQRMKLAGFEKDYFVIEYRGGGMLYLPSEQANSLSAYVGEGEPKMNALGGREFEQLKAKVKEKLEGFALELMKEYKARQDAKGFKFKSEEFLENAFASKFEFEETFDQIVAIKEVLSDMQQGKVMDRLLCGDVGFGKTEVAYRAAFRAIINQKQVAFLCPTTILSEQHALSAKKRMQDFGVKIELLNRFKKPNEVKDILEKIKKGEVDLVIGTHKLLSKNVVFKDLGLLIVDEEQRFGVADKEKIKSIKNNVDVLSLSATPIPRTLHMSLSGIRDISVLTTPPKERLPIQTYVTNEDDEVVASVIKRELARNGKVFVIYNRVQTIDKVASHIRHLVPAAKVGVAHGQMAERELQNVITKLFKNEYDVFVSTTLIENGIDLPSANTMIIYDADNLGLGQLYQLRGRIGRSDKLSYAYLLFKDGKLLTNQAYKRLEAIQEFKELGSGFKISMRDLELRGAGNVFGKEQHGHIEKVGYDMYVKLLNETIGKLQGKQSKLSKPVKIDLPVDAFIPEDYISDEDDRISYYVKVSQCDSFASMQELLSTFAEGFGTAPQSIVNLVKIAVIKNLAGEFDIKTVKLEGGVIVLELYKLENVIDERLVGVLGKYNASLKFENSPIIRIAKDGALAKMLDKIIAMLEEAKNEKVEKKV